MNRFKLIVAITVVILLLSCTQQRRADLLLHNGKIVTVDDDFSVHQALAVRDGKIVAVGSDELLRKFNPKQVLDLEGKMVIPGFNDTHIHISGRTKRYIDLTQVESIEDLKQKIREKVMHLGEEEWITGYGWSEDEFTEQRRPFRSDLDEAAPRNPVILWRAGGHSAVVNSMALNLAGITKNTPDSESGVIEHDKRGELSGIIRGRVDFISRFVPKPTLKEVRTSFIANLRNVLSMGITSIIIAGQWPTQYAEWEKVYQEYGEQLPRANVQIRWVDGEKMKAFGKKTGDGNERLRVGAVKLLVDGGFTGQTAYTLKPYKGQPNYRGKLTLSPEELRALVKEAHEMGWQLGFHAIGDAAISLTVEAFVEALKAAPMENHRHYIRHFTVTPPERILKLMVDHHILIAQQPNFTYTLEGRYVENLDGDRLQHNNPLRTPMKYGIFTAFGSDNLPISPMVGLYAAVTRKGMSGLVYGAEERLTIEAAIRAYTRNGAYLTFEEDIKGTLEPGKLADMVVLSEDILTIDPERIREVFVEKTFIGGKLVYDRFAH